MSAENGTPCRQRRHRVVSGGDSRMSVLVETKAEDHLGREFEVAVRRSMSCLSTGDPVHSDA